MRIFGTRYSRGHNHELKGKKLLKRKVFRHAGLQPQLEERERQLLARSCLEDGATAGIREISALAQAKLAYVQEVFAICARFRCKLFASIVVDEESGTDHDPDYLRKDYVYLFERFFYYLEDTCPNDMGIVVFDELEKSKSHILSGQMDGYFKRTENGRQRAGRVIPEPFFVHSDLTTGIQIADLVAYIMSWGFRVGELTKPKREEFDRFIPDICQMRHRAVREVDGNPDFVIWSFAVIRDLRAGEQ